MAYKIHPLNENTETVNSTVVRGVRTHNLKHINCEIPHSSLTVVTGVSGSGKSSLAFDTLYAEGQRRYTESLSTYARQFLQQMAKPPIDAVRNIQPAVALRQHNEINHLRSTVGTVTEINDHLQLLYTHAGETICPDCDVPVRSDTPSTIAHELAQLEFGTRLIIVANVDAAVDEHRATILKFLLQQGYRRLYIDHQVIDITDEDIESLLDRSSYPVVVDRVIVREDSHTRLPEAIEAALSLGKGRVIVYDYAGNMPEMTFNQAFSCNQCEREFIEPQPALFSFNSSLGACPTCSGFGATTGVDFKKVVPNPGLSLEDGAIACFQTPKYKPQQTALIKACMANGVPIDVPYRQLSKEHQQWVRKGGAGWKGIAGFFKSLQSKLHRTDIRILLAKYRGYEECVDCDGTRLSEDARCVHLLGCHIGKIWPLRLEQALEYFETIELPETSRARVDILLREIISRLRYLNDVGLGYLTLDRASRSLSGGEMQRIHLTASLGRSLTETLYVLDEPTAGLHARDSQRLLGVLYGLRDLGNTVVVVEHDPEIIHGADYVLEIGPQGGELGGEVIFEGSMDVFRQTKTLTSDSLNARTSINPSGSLSIDSNRSFRIVGACENNLANITVSFPYEHLSVVTGVSGSGKSTLLEKVLYNGWRRLQGYGGVDAGDVEALEGLDVFSDVVLMDQQAIGRSSRSNALSYTKAYDDIRKLYSQTKEAALRGLKVGDFSFNTPGGRCETCEGSGTITLEMHFIADVDVPCDVCDGSRFTSRVLAVEYHGKSIRDVFDLTVDEGIEFFKDSAPIVRKLHPLQEVGLGYLRLGQTTSTLSGGEAQRLKLATYIAQGRKRGDTDPILFIFDEPTVGLHLRDIELLVVALRKLVELGHTVVVIEHNTDFIAQCDYVVDIGPDAGPRGGTLVVAGTPLEVATCDDSITGRYLKELVPRSD